MLSFVFHAGLKVAKSKALSFYCWKQLNLSILVMGILSFLKRITKLIVDRTRKYFVGHLFTFSFQIIIIANWRIVYHILTSSKTRLQLDYPYTSYKSVMSLYMYVIHRPVSIKTKWRFVLNFTKIEFQKFWVKRLNILYIHI